MCASAFANHAEDNWPEPIKEYRTGQVLFDRLEVIRTNNDDDQLVWDMLAWYGGDENRIYFKSEGESTWDDGEPVYLESTELLASHLISPFWELQGGVGTRGTVGSDANRENYLVFSLFGLAPYQFEMDNSITINEDGDISMSLEAEYDVRLSQVSYIQPRIEMAASLSDAEEYKRPKGLNNIRLGLRYRYELSREFAPYIGVYWSRALGDMAEQIKAEGKNVSETGIMIGVRLWF
nr:copper resistance protein B [Kangiella koreensis]